MNEKYRNPNSFLVFWKSQSIGNRWVVYGIWILFFLYVGAMQSIYPALFYNGTPEELQVYRATYTFALFWPIVFPYAVMFRVYLDYRSFQRKGCTKPSCTFLGSLTNRQKDVLNASAASAVLFDWFFLSIKDSLYNPAYPNSIVVLWFFLLLVWVFPATALLRVYLEFRWELNHKIIHTSPLCIEGGFLEGVERVNGSQLHTIPIKAHIKKRRR